MTTTTSVGPWALLGTDIRKLLSSRYKLNKQSTPTNTIMTKDQCKIHDSSARELRPLRG